MIVRSLELFRDYSKINDQRFQFFLSIKASSVQFFVRIENFQILFDLFSLLIIHAIDNEIINEMIKMNILIISYAKHKTKTHIQQNLNKSFNFNQCVVIS